MALMALRGKGQDFWVHCLLPWACFFFTLLFYSYTWLYTPELCIACTFGGAFLGVGLLLRSIYAPVPGSPVGYSGLSKAPSLALGLLVLGGTLMGTVSGLFNFDQHAIFPVFYERSRRYDNVVPSEPSAAVADAGKVLFTSESFVDAAQGVGLIAESGTTYCAAPVRDGSPNAQVEFWATGIDCCPRMGTFNCDAAAEGGARAGIIVFDNNGYFGQARLDFYDRARRKAEAQFGLQSSSARPMFVRWVHEADLGMLETYYRRCGACFFVLASLGYLVLSAGAAELFAEPLPAWQLQQQKLS